MYLLENENSNDLTFIPIIIAVVAVVVILAVVLIVVLKLRSAKKNTPAQKAFDDRELIEQNAKSVEALIVLAEDNAELVEELRDLQNTLKYLIPSTDSKVWDYDKSIKNKIGDLRIALTKSDGENSKKSDEILTEIKLAVADRNTKA